MDITANYTWILPAVFTIILCYKTRRMETSEPLVQYQMPMDLQVWIATHFTPSYWDYWAQVDKKLYCAFTRSDRLWYFGQPPPLDDWQVWREPAWLLLELLFRSPFCFPTTLCILTVCLCFLLLTLRSVWGAKGLGPIKCGSRWQPGGMMGRRYEISSVLEDLLSLHWDHTYKTGAAAPYVSRKSH